MPTVSRRLPPHRKLAAFPLGSRPKFGVEIGLPTELEQVLSARGRPIPQVVTGEGLVDTGSTLTILDRKRIEELGVEPVDEVNMKFTGGKVACHVYPVSFGLKDDLNGPVRMKWLLRVVALPLDEFSCVCLIGRDVLSRGVFTYNGLRGEISFTCN